VTPSEYAGRSVKIMGKAFTPKAIRLAWRLLTDAFLDYRFESSSPIPLMPADLLSKIHSQEVVLPPRNLWMQRGNQTPDGLASLVSLARAIAARNLFEIGTFNGLTAWCLARNLPNAVVDTLDLPAHVSPIWDLEPGDEDNRIAFDKPFYEVMRAPGKVVQHWGDSAKFDFGPWSRKCDLVYVDGAHSEPYVESDTVNALHMVSEHGAVVWDDYWRQVSGVKRVLDRRSGLELYRIKGTRLVVYLTRGAVRRLEATSH
jgi:hypothetical protein